MGRAGILKSRGRTRFTRLLHIGSRPSHLRSEALSNAVAEAQHHQDVEGFEVARGLSKSSADATMTLADQEWIETTRQQVKAETHRLESELKGYKNNLIKESIRVSQTKGSITSWI